MPRSRERFLQFNILLIRSRKNHRKLPQKRSKLTKSKEDENTASCTKLATHCSIANFSYEYERENGNKKHIHLIIICLFSNELHKKYGLELPSIDSENF